MFEFKRSAPEIFAIPEMYCSKQGVPYVAPEWTGYLVLDMLPMLWGHPWNQVALNLVHAIRPTSIRVTTGATTTDAQEGRVTVTVTDDGMILHIAQECSVGLVGAEHGAALRGQLHRQLAGNHVGQCFANALSQLQDQLQKIKEAKGGKANV